jgi:hypothetical protein
MLKKAIFFYFLSVNNKNLLFPAISGSESKKKKKIFQFRTSCSGLQYEYFSRDYSIKFHFYVGNSIQPDSNAGTLKKKLPFSNIICLMYMLWVSGTPVK